MANVAFIISQPRSGSTLLQRMLGSHPQCLTGNETYLMLALLQGLRGLGGDSTARWAKTAATEFLSDFTTLPVFSYAMRSAADDLYGDALEKASFLCNALDRPRKFLYVDKTPRYFLILDDLLRMYQPESFVFLVRNPLDVLASVLDYDGVDHYQQLFDVEDRMFPGHSANRNLDVLDGPLAIADKIHSLGERACVVSYEMLTFDPEQQMRRVCKHVGIRYDAKVLTYDTRPESEFADKNSVDKHTAPVKDYVASWRTRIKDTSQIEPYLRRLGTSTIRRLGYPELIEEFDL